jgi:hypothetical protein
MVNLLALPPSGVRHELVGLDMGWHGWHELSRVITVHDGLLWYGLIPDHEL